MQKKEIIPRKNLKDLNLVLDNLIKRDTRVSRLVGEI